MKLLLLDLDGTVRKPMSNGKFITSPLDQQLISGVKEKINEASADGWTIVGITNQGGVAAGHKSLSDAIEEQKFTLSMAPQIQSILFCPEAGETCWEVDRVYSVEVSDAAAFKHLRGTYRKPESGMLKLAIQQLGGMVDLADPESSYSFLMIGDRPEDQDAAIAAGVEFMWAEDWRLHGIRKSSGIPLESIDTGFR